MEKCISSTHHPSSPCAYRCWFTNGPYPVSLDWGSLQMRVPGLGSYEIEQSHWLRAINWTHGLQMRVQDQKVSNQGGAWGFYLLLTTYIHTLKEQSMPDNRRFWAAYLITARNHWKISRGLKGATRSASNDISRKFELTILKLGLGAQQSPCQFPRSCAPPPHALSAGS